ncbi:hypothetical protein ACEWY4_014481 [Coilia grayii]|uniref:Uncharacterized protein n=1 Tax=Coilia grayii TaxID=363190 RepID=A0ABD1JSM8_9TELE
MTTRLLASFDEFDRYSKEVLSRHSRRNKLSHGEKCSTAFDELRSPFGVAEDWELYPTCDRETLKSKLNIDISKEKSPPHYSKAKCGPPSCKEPRSAQKVCSKVCICPSTNTNDLSQRTEDSKVFSSLTEKGEYLDGFMVVRLHKPSSAVCGKYVLHRAKWSSELERLTPMDVHLKYNSKAQTGGTLNYTNTYWSSSSNSGCESPISVFTEEENGHFTLTGSDGKVVTEQLQQGNIVRVTTSGRWSKENCDKDQLSTKEEPQLLPLCLDDELKKNHMKVLSAQAPTTYTPMPIVSETFPVVFNTGQPHNKPFSSKGFHTLDPTVALSRSGTNLTHYDRGNKIHSAIIRLTDTMQEKHAAGLQREASAKWSPPDYQDPSVEHSERGLDSSNLRVLSADGTLVLPAERDRLHVTSQCQEPKSRATPLLSLKLQPGSCGSVGTVLNGVNPKKNGGSPDNIKLHYGEGKTTVIIHGHPRPKLLPKKTPVSFRPKKSSSFFTSKPLTHPKSYQCISVHRQQKKVWHPLTDDTSHAVHGTSIGLSESRPHSHMDSGVPYMARNTPNPDGSDDQKNCSEHAMSTNKDYEHVINVPTADILL